MRGTTVSMRVTYSAAARAQDVTARASVFRRGRSLSFCDVEALDAAGNHVARGLVTYKLG
jgi:acyl-coenzyme A thioesterase PaaI-like protein